MSFNYCFNLPQYGRIFFLDFIGIPTLSRTERLLDLLQILRRHRYPVSGATLAAELGISLRTLYRDIQTLQAQGAQIDGEPGIGYRLRPCFMLPPLMFSEEELEALVLGSRWVAKRTDSRLALSSHNALAKIAAVLPDDLRNKLETAGLLVGPGHETPTGDEEQALIRQAIRSEHKMEITYVDLKDSETKRVIWPFAIGFFDQVRVLAAWCEIRQSFRHFRIDRIKKLTLINHRYPKRRQALLNEWRELNGISMQ
ncbi:helix-turn-helix transcriptional regulator [Legionella maceachernii]|uniref:Transcriptional regulator n=1 Tax=Legionella maceachernii TaxID=466 RepID=A0A0W0VWT7_9GAMM|nr:YafY family protein [Legionella maceachernii]KTD24458.1 transcriptional regulator [Legionella maceachernii]SJZ66105.1 Predicted DNA-binding transcriptional regulator YafY, contains an HTH and WYL domains [Legionella maceachernii]SUP01946.1 bifunctional biotin--[acetyl-CoA-carboxylase] synthetase/biotin operon repressor [Legionella maceachernii]